MELVDVLALPAQPTHDYRHAAFRLPTNGGMVCEFGVWRGDSLRLLCAAHPFVHGFDTFTGLPETWWLSATSQREAGHFAVPDFERIDWPSNCNLVAGRFCDTLPEWLAQYPGRMGLVHIDSDLYSSARDVLTLLNDRIVPGTLIAFDELCNFSGQYPLWQDGEWRALQEWLRDHDRAVRPVARSNEYQVTVEVVR